MSTPLPSLFATREAVANFVSDREWGKFHTPKNVMLALCGECGELCEIFQWKNSITKDIKELSLPDQIHVGEEISDCFIYCLRLSHLCEIDIQSFVLKGLDICDEYFIETFENITCYMSLNSYHEIQSILNIRDVVLYISSQVGLLSDKFRRHPDDQCIKMKGWQTYDREQASAFMSNILIALLHLSLMCDLDFQKNLERKFLSNNIKYPAATVRGSAAKYTAYTPKNGMKTILINSLKTMLPYICGFTCYHMFIRISPVIDNVLMAMLNFEGAIVEVCSKSFLRKK